MVESETLHEFLKIPLRLKSPKCAQFSMWNVCLFGDLQELFFLYNIVFQFALCKSFLIVQFNNLYWLHFFNEANCYLLQNLSCNLTVLHDTNGDLCRATKVSFLAMKPHYRVVHFKLKY